MITLSVKSTEKILVEIELTEPQFNELKAKIQIKPTEFACSKTQELVINTDSVTIVYWSKVTS